MKSLKQYANDWQKNAEADPYWVILTDSKYYGRKWNTEAFFATGEEEIARVFDFMKQNELQAHAGSFLDFGCGVGRISKALRKRFRSGNGVDISSNMINIARTHVDGVEFLVNESASLSQFKENSIDFVYSHIVLQHMPNEYQKLYIDEFLRVLRPGGLAVFQIPVDIVHKLEMSPSLAYLVKRKLKEWLPVLVSIKRALVPAKKFHYDFRYEMHSLSDAQIRCICDRRGCVIKAAPATNSCEPDHNGRVEFFDIAAHRKLLEASQLPNRYLSCMYFVSKPFPSN